MNIPTELKLLSKTLGFIFALSLSTFKSAHSEELSDEDFFDDIPIVLTVSRLKQPKSEAPSSVTIINRDMIKSAGIRELADIFRLVPGFIVGYNRGNNPVVTYQGMGYDFNRQLQVLIDGRSVFIPSFGGIPWVHLPVIIEDIEKVEITRGPNAASYGSNSFLAVINIITTDASQDDGINASFSRSNDHKNIKDGYFSLSHLAKDFDLRISANTISDDGFESFDATTPNNDSKDINKFNFRSNFLVTQNSHWSFQFGLSDDKTERGDGTSGDFFRQENVLNQFQTLSYEQSSDNSSTSVKLFHTTHKVDDAFDTLYEASPGLNLPVTVSFDRQSERTEFELQHSIDVSKQLRLVIGGSYREDVVDSFFLLGDNSKQDLNVSRLFSHAEYKINSNQIFNIGAMLEKSDDTDLSISPRIAFVQHLNDLSTMRIAYSKAFRNPILFERYGNWAFKLNPTPSQIALAQALSITLPSSITLFTGNSDIKPEEIESFEIGFNSRISKSLDADIKIYQTDLDNQILTTKVFTPTEKTQNQNLASTQTTGIELSTKYSPSKKFLINSGFTISTTESDDAVTQKTFPTRSAFFLTRYDINKYHSVSGAYYFLGKFRWLDFNINETDIKKLDLRYAFSFMPEKQTPLTLEIIGQNMLDDYADYVDSNIHSKSLHVKLSTQF